MKTIKLNELRKLTLPGSQKIKYLSAASGLVKFKDSFLVVADDEQFLGVFNKFESEKDFLIKLDETELPENLAERKKRKRDWESLSPLQIDDEKFVLALPSGSTENRELAVLVSLEENFSQGINPKMSPISCGRLFHKLREEIPNLNIEGTCVSGENVLLFQRGNGKDSFNAIIVLKLRHLVEGIVTSRELSGEMLSSIKKYDLGTVNGVKYCFTDGCSDSRGGVWFLAAAEASESTYDDGLYQGAVLGCMNQSLEIERIYKLDSPVKPEGLCIEIENDAISGFIVTDGDDPTLAACLYSFSI